MYVPDCNGLGLLCHPPVLVAIEQPVDTSTVTGKAFFDMLGVFAEFETNLRRELQADGIAAARNKSIYKG